MKRILLIALCLCSGVAFAAETETKKKTPTEELFELMRYEELSVESAIASFDGSIDQMKAQGVSPAAIAEVRKAARDLFQRIFGDPKLRQQTMAIYEKYYTPDEITELTGFYRTPLGRKSLAAMPSIMQDSMKLAMPLIQKEMPGFQQKVAEIVTKDKEKAAPLPTETEDLPEKPEKK